MPCTCSGTDSSYITIAMELIFILGSLVVIACRFLYMLITLWDADRRGKHISFISTATFKCERYRAQAMINNSPSVNQTSSPGFFCAKCACEKFPSETSWWRYFKLSSVSLMEQGKLSNIQFWIIFPVIRKVDVWLETGWAKYCHFTLSRTSRFMSKAMPFTQFQVSPLSRNAH